MFVAILSIYVAEKYHPVEHKLYRTFHYYAALAQDKDIMW